MKTIKNKKRKEKLKIYFLSDRVYPGISANKIAKVEMAKAFSKDKFVSQVQFYYPVNQKYYRIGPDTKKLLHKTIYIPFYQDENKNLAGYIYRKLIGNPIMIFIFTFKILLNQRSDKKNYLYYIRGDKVMLSMFIASIFKKYNFILEIHNYTFGDKAVVDTIYKYTIKKAKLLITISKYTKENWVKNGVDEEKIFVISSGVNLSFFTKPKNLRLRKRKLFTDSNKKIILYSGQLYMQKGIDTFVLTAKLLPDLLFVVLGGSKDDVNKYKKMAKKYKIRNISFVGNIQHKFVKNYLYCADILVIPNNIEDDISRFHTSPLKLGEYMAVKKPIVASALPSISQFVDKLEVTFFKPGDYEDLAQKIKEILAKEQKYRLKALKAYKKAKTMTWERRTNRILKAYDIYR